MIQRENDKTKSRTNLSGDTLSIDKWMMTIENIQASLFGSNLKFKIFSTLTQYLQIGGSSDPTNC